MTCVCPNCDTFCLEDPIYSTIQPTNENILYKSKNEALSCIIAESKLRYSKNYGLVFNELFNPELIDYSERYQYTLSPTNVFFGFISNLVDKLVYHYGYRNKDIIETFKEVQ